MLNPVVQTIKPARKFGHRYPWEEWFGRTAADLLRGRDFPAQVEPQSVAVMARVYMKRMGLSRTIRIKGDRVLIGPKSDFRGRKVYQCVEETTTLDG